MTTILKAQRDLEHAAELVTPRLAWVDRYRVPAGVIIVTLLVIASVTMWYVSATRPLPHPVSRQRTKSAPPAHEEAPQAAPPPAAPVEAPRPAAPPAPAESPWGRVEKSSGAPPAAAEAAAAPPAPSVSRVVPRRAERLAAAPAAKADKPATIRQPAVKPPAPNVRAAAVPGEPNVQLQSISYSATGSGRSATLLLDGTRSVTLHEGDSLGGIEVQLILPRTVYLRHGGNVFAVSTER